MRPTVCAEEGCNRPPREHVGRGCAPIYCWKHAKRSLRRRTIPAAPRPSALNSKERVDPILYAWRQVNPGRPIPPQLLTDPRASTIGEARQHRESDWRESWA